MSEQVRIPERLTEREAFEVTVELFQDMKALFNIVVVQRDEAIELLEWAHDNLTNCTLSEVEERIAQADSVSKLRRMDELLKRVGAGRGQ